MNIIISGGWGYGNLGDDAILLSTIKIIERKYPTSEIIILTYNIAQTKTLMEETDKIKIRSSIHSILEPQIQTKIFFKTKINKLLNKLIGNKINNLKKEHNSKRIIQHLLKSPIAVQKKYQNKLQEYVNICKNANLYIMAGGGYINDWNYSIASKYLEILIAKQFNIQCYSIGQTIGPFHKIYTKKLAKKLFSNMDFMFFRDTESIKDIKEMGLNCIEEAVPDLALYESYSAPKKNQIVLIPFLYDILNNIKGLGENLKNIAELSKCEIIITVSQLWYNQYQIAFTLYLYLQKLNLNPKLVLPRNMYDLQDIIAQSRFVISQNLHGLILGYRSNCIVISLNSRRKFKTFMESINASDRIIEPNQIRNNELYNIFKENLNTNQLMGNKFQSQILSNLNKI